MSLKEFILSKVFLKHLGLAVAIAVGFILIMLLFLNIYTRHGQSQPVPDFFGLTMAQTDSLATKTRMRYQIVDSVFTSLVPRGCITEQNPKPGFRVKKWRNISLIINAFRPEMVAMPDLVDLPLNHAIAIIKSSGLEAGLLSYKPDLSIDMVLNQKHNGKDIVPGDSIQKGSVIDLVLGKGLSNQRTVVPDLVGMNLEPARDRILRASLNLGTFIYDNTILTGDDSLNAFVFKQNPEYDDEATLQLGDVIYLWLTVDSMKLPVDSTLIMIPDTIPSLGLNMGADR
ncbi:MAG: PASTA domain-containing protein [Bacteroidales bacterium]|nr:PASTA domain-containing protein [Bacteroidales bacterium]